MVRTINAPFGWHFLMLKTHDHLPRLAQDKYEQDLSIREMVLVAAGNLSPSEVMTLLEMEGLDSSEEHVAMLFEHYDADGEVRKNAFLAPF
jgi:hypothetical protein